MQCFTRLNARTSGVSATLAVLLALPLAVCAAPAEVQPAAAPAAPQQTGPAVVAPAPTAPATMPVPEQSAPATPEAGTAPAAAPAAQPPAQQPAPLGAQGPVASPAAGSLLQTILALCFVLALLAGLAWFLKRYGPKATTGSAPLRIVGALNLGGRERIMVVEVGGQWIVVGAAPGRVNALATMPKPEGAEASATLAEHQPPAASFSEWLKQTIDKRNAK